MGREGTTAEFEGRCALCDEGIWEGDELLLFDGWWCHRSCVEEEEGLRDDHEDRR